jgi:hypothetical protein
VEEFYTEVPNSYPVSEEITVEGGRKNFSQIWKTYGKNEKNDSHV